MFFFLRNWPLVILAIVDGVLAIATFDAPQFIFGALGAVVFVMLLLAVAFDRYEGPK